MSMDSYSTRQREKDAKYRREYVDWIESLPPEERRQVPGDLSLRGHFVAPGGSTHFHSNI